MKTGLNLQPINEPIIKRVMEKYNFTKLSPAINYIIQEYSKFVNEKKSEEKPVSTRVEISKPDYSGWFVAEENK